MDKAKGKGSHSSHHGTFTHLCTLSRPYTFSEYLQKYETRLSFSLLKCPSTYNSMPAFAFPFFLWVLVGCIWINQNQITAGATSFLSVTCCLCFPAAWRLVCLPLFFCSSTSVRHCIFPILPTFRNATRDDSLLATLHSKSSQGVIRQMCCQTRWRRHPSAESTLPHLLCLTQRTNSSCCL